VQLSFLFSRQRAPESALRPAEEFDLVIRFIRWLRALAVRPAEAAKFALSAENNFMVESG
jgi:hypothetical protein